MNIVSDAASITAYDPNGEVFAGAFQPEGVETWRLYLTRILLTEHHRCHPVVCNRADALQWVTVIASLYEAANPPTRHLNGADYSGIAAHLEDQP
jgi:hypothetical protein